MSDVTAIRRSVRPRNQTRMRNIALAVCMIIILLGVILLRYL